MRRQTRRRWQRYLLGIRKVDVGLLGDEQLGDGSVATNESVHQWRSSIFVLFTQQLFDLYTRVYVCGSSEGASSSRSSNENESIRSGHNDE